MNKYYVVVGVCRYSGTQEIINGFYTRAEAVEEAACNKHTHKCLRVVAIEDNLEAMNALIQQLNSIGE
jgi:hypothetical protein